MKYIGNGKVTPIHLTKPGNTFQEQRGLVVHFWVAGGGDITLNCIAGSRNRRRRDHFAPSRAFR